MPSRVDALLLCVCCAGCLRCLFPVYARLLQYFALKRSLALGCGCHNKELCSILSHPSVAVQVFSMLLTGLSRVHGLGVFFVTIVLWA